MNSEKNAAAGREPGCRSRDAPERPAAGSVQRRSTAGFVLGLCSAALPFVCPPLILVALACGIIGIVLTAPAKGAVRPRLGNAGFVLSIIGTTVNGLLLILAVLVLLLVVGAVGVMLEDLGRATASSPDLGALWEAIAGSVRALG